jgi:hypothetical protein
MTIRKPFERVDLRGCVPESWACIDCGVNTAPGCFDRARLEPAYAVDWEGKGVTQTVDHLSEVYMVRPAVWTVAGMTDGCLCIGCLEKRLGRTLTPKDFPKHALNSMPGTARLRARRAREVKVRLLDD